MNRLRKRWIRLRREGRKALIPFITAGDPSLAATGSLVIALEKAGADIIELGVPFSDPMADGPVIQKASERALAKGVTLKKVLRLVREIRTKRYLAPFGQIPILLMGYYNPVLAYGLRAYARDAARVGVDATLIVDLPPEESGDLDRELRKVGIDLIYLLTPTSDAGRIRKVARRARGFIYFVSMTGVTGASLKSDAEIRRKVLQIRRQTKVPVVVGFGISNPVQAGRIARLADGVVVGSVLVDLIARGGSIGRLSSRVGGFFSKIRRVVS